MRASWLRLLSLCILGLLCTSCSETRKPLFPARGKIVFESTPAEGVLVIFTPVSVGDPSKDWPEGYPRAVTEKDGTFQVSTYQPGDGIPAGDYSATMLWTAPRPDDPERSLPDKLGGRYSDPQKSTFKVSIQAGENQLPEFHVTRGP